MHRAWVLEAPEDVRGPQHEYLAVAEAEGWTVEDGAEGSYLKRETVCLRAVASSDPDDWETFDVAAHARVRPDRRLLVVGNLVNGGARWDAPRPTTEGPLRDQCAIGL